MAGDREVGDEFVKFPRTPHLFWLGPSEPRDDKLLSSDEAAALLHRSAAVEEKVDGACLGLSVGPDGEVRAQNRGSYLDRPGPPQFRTLWSWLTSHELALRASLGSGLVLFGEWCYARHSVPYDALPDWFLAFDVYDRAAGRFWSRHRRDQLAERVGVHVIPLLTTGMFDRRALERMLGASMLGHSPMEGLYLRWDEGPWLVARAKVVRPEWVQVDDRHWSRRPLEPNRTVSHARAAGGALFVYDP